MNFLQFRQVLHPFEVFSVRDVGKLFPNFDARRLFEWQRKGYIHKLTNKWYFFSDLPVSEMFLYRISNCLCRPSYISLESAFSYYNLIPEGVYSQQAVTTRKTISYQTPVGTFDYRSIKSTIFFGYQIIRDNESPLLMAEIEKALLDYLYLSANVKTETDLEALRFDYPNLRDAMDWKKLEKYAMVFGSKTLNNKINKLKTLVQNANLA